MAFLYARGTGCKGVRGMLHCLSSSAAVLTPTTASHFRSVAVKTERRALTQEETQDRLQK